MVYFLSDAHLGSRVIADPEQHQQRIVALLQRFSEDADAVYLLGDIFDFWYEYIYRFKPHSLPHSKRQYTPIIRCIKELCNKGIQVHFFIGNHDIWTFGLIHELTGAVVHKKAEYVSHYGKTLFLAHGDGLIPTDYLQHLPKDIQRRIRSFIRLRRFFHHPVPQTLYRMLPPFIADSFGYEWARRSRLKELKHPCPYKGDDKEELVLYAKECERFAFEQKHNRLHSDFYIFGHRHIPLQLRIADNSEVIILGDCFRQFNYAQLNKKGELQLLNF